MFYNISTFYCRPNTCGGHLEKMISQNATYVRVIGDVSNKIIRKIAGMQSLSLRPAFSCAGPRWLSGKAYDSGARGPGFEPHNRRIVSLSKTP